MLTTTITPQAARLRRAPMAGKNLPAPCAGHRGPGGAPLAGAKFPAPSAGHNLPAPHAGRRRRANR